MLAVIVCTGVVRLLFRDGNAPSFFGSRYVYYTEDDMGSRVPEGSLVFAEDTDQINTQDIVLYKNEQDEYRIAVASLIVDTDSSVPDQTGKTYYLTTVTNTTAFETDGSKIVGICLRRSAELGALVGFLTGIAGMIVGLILPVVLLLIYLVMVIAKGSDSDEYPEDADNDLEFVKSIQQKQQRIAERDAERAEKERRKVQTFDDGFYDDIPHKAEKPVHRLSDEEAARIEEEEAARRAERIAAVRSHMEQRRQTETPDGVPLYTTEIITKTHTLSIPRTGDKPLTTTQQKPLKPTPTEDIPRLTATGHIQIPTAEQLAEEKAREDRMRKAQALARAAQDEAFGLPSYRGSHEQDEPVYRNEAPAPAPAPAPAVRPAPAPVQPAAAPAPAPVIKPAPAASAPAAPAPTPAPAEPEKKTVKKTVKKPQIASASFNDLMAFLDNEQKKL